MSDAPVLSAGDLKQALDAPASQTAEKTYSFKLSVFERSGMAYTGWSLDPDYAIGKSDFIAFYPPGGATPVTFSVTGPFGIFDPKRPFAAGMWAAYFSLDGPTNAYRVLVRTDTT